MPPNSARPGVGARIAGAAFQIIITLLLASSAWSVVKIAINRHLPHEKRDALALVSDEGAGHGLSRIETLLPLVRMFLFVTIVAMTLMSVVSAMGVNIGPLLAGAGVVGIAVGFGAQTLVRDILSGIFFLFDDAFRIGEYIDIGEGKGTVERMSIRAVMLRHQLGYIYTVPFGAIRRVANYSRDWMIMKLEVRVPFSTDLERLRKIVKQVGTEMKDDPEIGSMFLQPLKAQGVNRIDNSAFIVRIKFMARAEWRSIRAAPARFQLSSRSISKERHPIRHAACRCRWRGRARSGDGGGGSVSFDRRVGPSPWRRGGGALATPGHRDAVRAGLPGIVHLLGLRRIQRYAGGRFRDAQNQRGFDMRDVGRGGQAGAQEALIAVPVGRDDLQQKIGFAGQHVRFAHLGPAGDQRLEGLQIGFGLAPQPDSVRTPSPRTRAPLRQDRHGSRE